MTRRGVIARNVLAVDLALTTIELLIHKSTLKQMLGSATEWRQRHLFNLTSQGTDLVAGESSGGNMAVTVAMSARDRKLPMPVAIASIYPVAGTDTDTPSYRENAQAMPLGKADMEWFFSKEIARPGDKQDPRLNLVGDANLQGLPPTLVITDQIDPLMSEGKKLADKLQQAGVTTTYHNFDGVTHEFFGMGPAVMKAERAENMVAGDLRHAFMREVRQARR